MMVASRAGRGGGARLLDGREKERIYRTYRGLVAEVVSWKLAGVPRQEVEEVVSGLWAKLYACDCARIRTFGGRNGAMFPTWLTRVARNAAVDYLRRRRLVVVPLDPLCEDGNPCLSGSFLWDRSAPDPLERLIAREVRAEVVLAVKILPRIYRQVVCARFYKGRSAREIAAACGIDEDTVYVRLARAFAKLRRELERRGLGERFEPEILPVPRAPRPRHAHLSDIDLMRRIAAAVRPPGRPAAAPGPRAGRRRVGFAPPDVGELCGKRVSRAASTWEAALAMPRVPG